MDLTDYFDGVDFNIINENLRLNPKYSLGKAIERNTQILTEENLAKVDLAILGIPLETVGGESKLTHVPGQIRKSLYQLAVIEKLNIIDLGNLKMAQSHKGNFLALRDVVDYLTELKVTVLVLGGSEDFGYGICQAFRNNKFFTFSTIDALLDVRRSKEVAGPPNYLSRIFSKQPDIFQFSLIGYQRHQVPGKLLSKTKGVSQHIGLGELRGDISVAEPVMRNSDFVSFDLSTLKYADARGRKKMPNGLCSDEACQLARYAGLSSKVSVFALFEVDDTEKLNTALAAEAAWYFMEGVAQRSPKHPEQEDGFVVHKVEVWQIETPLVFYEDSTTGRWWMRLQSIGNTFVFMACSEQDYVAASHNEIPEIYLKYVQKIDEILK